MFYVDSQRTVTRRDSSLIRSKTSLDIPPLALNERESDTTIKGTAIEKPKQRKVQDEIVTMMFDSMLSLIIQSWEPIEVSKPADDSGQAELSETLLLNTPFKKNKSAVKAKSKKTSMRDKSERRQSNNDDSLVNERAIIHFKNGNMYEGDISMKCMHGEGRFQWSDGTVYLGHFIDNEMKGTGIIQWKNDTWYQGEFAGNLRHGEGIYVDSRRQRSYSGGWQEGTKHGYGLIHYSNKVNSYEGDWIRNIRSGYGMREYSATSGYMGEWENDQRHGKGVMVYPNSDCYLGQWNRNVMSGYGVYVWNKYYNQTMASPPLSTYHGYWQHGERNGYGMLRFGLGLGTFYDGDFKNNDKHGHGRIITSGGYSIEGNNLFVDNTGPFLPTKVQYNDEQRPDFWQFDYCDITVGLSYHIEQAFKAIADNSEDKYKNMINEYLKHNTPKAKGYTNIDKTEEHRAKEEEKLISNLITFEEKALRNAIKYFEQDLRAIYNKYAAIYIILKNIEDNTQTIYNIEEIHFKPVMIRLYLWQLYFDCNINSKGLTLYEIDLIFYENRKWLAMKPHDPFEKIFFWQFLQSIISVANKLYAKKTMPGPQPDTVLAAGFRKFMKKVILPGTAKVKGRLTQGYGQYIPLKALYALYQSLGEPHTIPTFLRAVHHPTHDLTLIEPPMVEPPKMYLPWGRNAYMLGEDLVFLVEKVPEPLAINTNGLKLFNIGNLSTKKIVKIFGQIFPQILNGTSIANLDIQLTFYDFFEVFIACVEESIQVKFEMERELTAKEYDDSKETGTAQQTTGRNNGGFRV